MGFMINRSCLKFVMILFFTGIIFGCAGEIYSQATSGTILGQVTDSQGAAVPQATVTAKNESTGLNQNVETNDNGEYSLSNLPPGLYTITVSKDGFTTALTNENRLQIDQKLRLNIQLTVGAVSETVNVTTEALQLQTQTTETSQVVETKSISDLPLLGRNFLDLTRLSTGVVSGGGGNQLNIAVNGQREFSNSVVIDGIEVTGNRNNDTGLSPSVDSVQEFKIQTSAYAAEYGKASGASVLIQTKPGTNEFHGSLYEFFRPTGTAARPFFATQRPNLKQHNFGGTIGGPIVKDNLFFFFSYEGSRSRNSFDFLDAVPPVQYVKFLPSGDADLSGLIDPLTGNQIPIFDPVYLNNDFYIPQQFPGNIIPANRVSRAGRAILQQLFPKPTILSGTDTLRGYYNNFPVSQPYRYDSNKYEAKVDYNISDSDRLAVSYKLTPYKYSTGDRFGGAIPIEGGGSTDSADSGDAKDQIISITQTHIFSNSLVNEFRFGFARFRFLQDDLITDQTAANSLGLGNINLADFPQTGGLPFIALGTGYTTGGSTFKPLSFLDRNFQFTDNVTKTFGSHSLKAGVNFRFLNAKPTFSILPTGYFYFNGAYASLTSDPYFYTFDPNALYGNGGSDIADLLLGYPGFVSIGLQLTDPRTKSRETAFYVQDSWQVNQRLVLNYGLRYEYQTPFTEENNNISNFDLTTNRVLLAGRGGNSEALINPDKNNFMPRVGLAYKLTDRTVLRTGYGVFFTPENDARSDVLTKNYPFATRADYSNFTFYNDFGAINFAANYSLDTGIPRVTAVTIPDGASSISAFSIPNARNQAFYYVDPNFKTGYSQLFNVILQHELFKSFTVEAGYVGSLSRKLPYAVGNLNRSDRISSQLGKIEGQFAIGSGNYHSLQVKADKRFSQGNSFYVAYTFAKCIDNGPAPFNLGRNNQSPQDPFNLAAERALCGFDVKNNLVGSFIYELPFGKGKKFLSEANPVVDVLLGGWQLNSIINVRSGLPVNVIRSSGDGTALRPNIIGDPYQAGPVAANPDARCQRTISQGGLAADEIRTLGSWFNPCAFSTSGLSATAFGNAGRNILRGPGYANLDMSLFKNFALSRFREGMNFQVRFELFNITNTPHFGNPNAVLGQGNFSRITQSIGNARIIQFAGKFNF